MSSGLIVLIFIVALILIVGYVVAVILRKRNEALLAALEERKEKLYNLPVNDEVEAVKNMHLIGQSQIAFREWNQKWVDLSLNSFADIENNLFEAEGYNNSFRFMKAKQAIDNIESQIQLIDEDIKAIRQALSDLEEQEQKNSGRVVHALDMFEELQKEVTSDPDRYGSALPEIVKQIGNIESRFQQLHASLKNNMANVSALELDNAIYENEQIQEEIDALYHIFTREIESQKVVKKLVKQLPGYLKHAKDNNSNLAAEVERLSKTFVLNESFSQQLKELEAELSSQENVVEDALKDSSETQKAYSIVEEELEAIEARLKEIEDEQIGLSDSLSKIEKDDANARQKVNIYANRLHAIKRYMDKRNLPGIPQEFLELFFTASNNTEALMDELEGDKINIESTNRL